MSRRPARPVLGAAGLLWLALPASFGSCWSVAKYGEFGRFRIYLVRAKTIVYRVFDAYGEAEAKMISEFTSAQAAKDFCDELEKTA